MENIEIKNLSFTYPKRHNPAIESINLNIESGEFVTVFGKSGCGKSTLLKQLKPQLAPVGKRIGKIFVGDKDILELSEREQAEKIGFVTQNADNGIVTDKVWHELAFGLENLGMSGNEIRARVAETAAFFGITDWFHKKTCELSGGQKQLLNLAAVMVMQPSILILDEPTAQLDPIAAHNFLETIVRINRELGMSVILTEHRLEEVFPVSDKVVFIKSGKIEALGTPKEVCKKIYENSDDIMTAFPSPARIYYASNGKNEPPLTIRDGRKWLKNQKLLEADKVKEENKENKENKELTLQIKEIWFRYEKNLPDIIKGLSFKAYTGEIYALLGGNGAGKSTMLSVFSGINKIYRGKITIFKDKKVSLLPQNPKTILCEKNILKDLLESVPAKSEKYEDEVRKVIDFCGLSEILESHPYDISGGEQQRAALAKILLKNPDIILLDEPTKGLDSCFKEKFASLLKELAGKGKTIIIVSHDIEFCAKYADRCGMFFDGQIISEGTPKEFFVEKNFYTTAASRLSRGIMKETVLDDEIITALSGTKIEKKQKNGSIPLQKEIFEREKANNISKKIIPKRYFYGFVACLVFILTCILQINSVQGSIYFFPLQVLSVLELGITLVLLFPRRKKSNMKIEKGKLNKRTIIAAFFVLIMVPFTILWGICSLEDRKYYFISMLIIAEIMIPFFMIFEGRKPQARELVIISVLCAAAVAGRTAFFMLPQFKPVAAIVIISGICFGGETGFLVGAVTGFVSNFFFGQGPWTPWHMFSFGILGFLAGILAKKGLLYKKRLPLSIFGFLVVLIIYGGIMNPASIIMSSAELNINAVISSYIMGFPYDLIHASSTAFFLWFIAEPMIEKLERIKTKYGLMG